MAYYHNNNPKKVVEKKTYNLDGACTFGVDAVKYCPLMELLRRSREGLGVATVPQVQASKSSKTTQPGSGAAAVTTMT